MTVVIVLPILLATIIIFYYKWTNQYWPRKNVPLLEQPITLGSIINAINRKENIGLTIKQVYDYMKSRKWKHGGVNYLFSPYYFVIDLDYIKTMLTKDFQYFPDRHLYHNEKDDPLSANLFFLTGTRWRNLRPKLTPSFTSSKIRGMFQNVVNCGVKLETKIQKMSARKEPIDVKEMVERFTTEIIGCCAFGLECKMFEDENPSLLVYNKKVVAISKWKRILETFAIEYPNLAKIFGVRIVPADAAAFFLQIIKKSVFSREKNHSKRNDLLQTLMENCQTINEVAAQSLLFFVAGFDTLSSHVAFTMYELAKNFDIQKKLRNEIRTVLAQYDGKITYEALKDMKYLNQVVKVYTPATERATIQSLRKYPPAPVTSRRCVKSYKVPGENTIIDKGTPVIIPILGIHYDQEYYPDPEKFNPDRFNEENNRLRPSFAFLPFGEGPRMCIGMRLALIQAKVALISMLKNFEFSVNEDRTKEPMKMMVDVLILSPDGGVWFDAHLNP